MGIVSRPWGFLGNIRYLHKCHHRMVSFVWTHWFLRQDFWQPYSHILVQITCKRAILAVGAYFSTCDTRQACRVCKHAYASTNLRKEAGLQWDSYVVRVCEQVRKRVHPVPHDNVRKVASTVKAVSSMLPVVWYYSWYAWNLSMCCYSCLQRVQWKQEGNNCVESNGGSVKKLPVKVLYTWHSPRRYIRKLMMER